MGMRLPLDKVYRAFPELDQFSDEQCQSFVKRARERLDFQTFSSWVVAGGGCGGVIGALLITIALVGPLGGLFRVWLGRPVGDDVVGGLLVFLWIAGPALGGLLARDAFIRRHLRRTIWKELDRLRCSTCRYLLLGQHVQADQSIRCPECGSKNTLEQLGLSTAADLLPPENASAVRGE